MEYYTAIKRNETGSFVVEVDGPRVCHTEWSMSEREKQISYDIAYMRNLKKKNKGTNELIYTTEIESWI